MNALIINWIIHYDCQNEHMDWGLLHVISSWKHRIPGILMTAESEKTFMQHYELPISVSC